MAEPKSAPTAQAVQDVGRTNTRYLQPLAIPYPNIANLIDAQAKNGNAAAKRKQEEIIKATGSKSATAAAIMHGDEAGSAAGIMSSKQMGNPHFITYSLDVETEGKSVNNLAAKKTHM